MSQRKNKSRYKEENIMNSSICFLTKNPPDDFYKLIKDFIPNHKVYVCIDNNNHKVDWEGVEIIQMDENIPHQAGYHSMHLDKFPKFYNKSISREKAHYYIHKNLDTNHVWFIEEDVFIPRHDLLKQIDDEFKDSDLLIRDIQTIETHPNWPHWIGPTGDSDNIIHPNRTWLSGKKISNKDLKRSMISAVRVSKKFVECMDMYLHDHNRIGLFMDELCIPTLAYLYNLKIDCPKELGYILWRDGEQKDNEYIIFPYSKDKVNENMMYHPIKDLKRQIKLRFGDESIKDKDR